MPPSAPAVSGPSGSVYISGPMTAANHTGDYNYPAFHSAEERIRALAPTVTKVFNPADTFNGDTTRQWQDYMRVDVGTVLESDCVVCLPGWENGAGSRVEVLTAVSIGIPVYGFTNDLNALRCLYTATAGRPAALEILSGVLHIAPELR